MSNNLRQIAKDLRSFVKRCKDVHYSDSLLITFLVTGLLTFAPRLHADVAAEQQEVSAQTYDAITDLRQSFIRARKENEQSLKGAERELAMLLQQGDQVIKSPWASFQFGTGFANNDWGTTYRGRGGKFLEYYRRDNDLTKYVFDKNKHLYGATNLNIPRNQEPNSLTINPANVHEAYKNYTPERLDNISMPNAVSYNPVIYTSNNINLPANYVQNGTTAYYNLNATDPIGNNKTWGYSSTFDRVNNRIMTYDGWDASTKNQWQTSYSEDLQGTATSKGVLHNGNTSGGTEVWGNHTNYGGGTTYYSWLPSSSWSAGVYYYNLNKPAPNSTKPGGAYTSNTYFTPGSGYTAWHAGVGDTNGSTGYDGVSSSVSVPWYEQWRKRNFVQTNEVVGNAIIDYYIESGSNINASGTNAPQYRANYRSHLAGAEAAANATTHPHHSLAWWNAYNAYMRTQLGTSYNYDSTSQLGATPEENYVRQQINDTAGNLVANAWNWYSTATSRNSGHDGYSRREVLLLTNKTMNVKYLDAHISLNQGNVNGFNGGAFAKALAGANLTIEDVDVSMYNGNAGAYVIHTGTTSSDNITLNFTGTSNSIANFDTTNGRIDDRSTGHTDGNIAFNFQEGTSPETGGGLQGVTEIKGQYDVRFKGNNNIVYNCI